MVYCKVSIFSLPPPAVQSQEAEREVVSHTARLCKERGAFSPKYKPGGHRVQGQVNIGFKRPSGEPQGFNQSKGAKGPRNILCSALGDCLGK